MKLTPIAVWRTSASPWPGGPTSMSSQRSASGPPGAWMRMAFERTVAPVAARLPRRQGGGNGLDPRAAGVSADGYGTEVGARGVAVDAQWILVAVGRRG